MVPPRKKQRMSPPEQGGRDGSQSALEAASESQKCDDIPELPFEPITKDEKTTWGGWCELESDPAFFNAILHDWGVRGAKVYEVFGLDDVSLSMLPQPIYGLVFLYKYRDLGNDDDEGSFPPDVWFANQTHENACGTTALLNIVFNVPAVDLGENLTQFKEFTKDLTPEMRGDQVGHWSWVKSVHNSFARKMDILNSDLLLKEQYDARHLNDLLKPDASPPKRKRPAPKSSERKSKSAAADDALCGNPGGAFHFTALVPIRGDVWRLDGLNKKPEKLPGRYTWSEPTPEPTPGPETFADCERNRELGRQSADPGVETGKDDVQGIKPESPILVAPAAPSDNVATAYNPVQESLADKDSAEKPTLGHVNSRGSSEESQTWVKVSAVDDLETSNPTHSIPGLDPKDDVADETKGSEDDGQVVIFDLGQDSASIALEESNTVDTSQGLAEGYEIVNKPVPEQDIEEAIPSVPLELPKSKSDSTLFNHTAQVSEQQPIAEDNKDDLTFLLESLDKASPEPQPPSKSQSPVSELSELDEATKRLIEQFEDPNFDSRQPTRPPSPSPAPEKADWLAIALPQLQEWMTSFEACGGVEFSLLALVQDPLIAQTRLLAQRLENLTALECRLDEMPEGSPTWRASVVAESRSAEQASAESWATLPGGVVRLNHFRTEFELPVPAADLPPDVAPTAEIKELCAAVDADRASLIGTWHSQVLGVDEAAACIRETHMADAHEYEKARQRRTDYAPIIWTWLKMLSEKDGVMKELIEASQAA